MPTVWSDNEQGAELGTTFMQALLECENAAEVLAILGLSSLSVGDVTLTGIQTLENKTLTSPAINTPTITGGAFTGGTDIALADGGTGASTAANARTNLGLGTMAVEAAASYLLASGGTDLAIADGGTGQSTAQLAVNALSAVAAATNEHVLTKDTGTGNAVFKAAAGGLAAASQAEQEAASSTAVGVTPGRQQFHPSAAKAWINFDGSTGTPTINASYNVTSLTDNAAGDWTVNFTTAFSTANYGFSMSARPVGGDTNICMAAVAAAAPTAGAFRIKMHATGAGTGTTPDSTLVGASFYGDQA